MPAPRKPSPSSPATSRTRSAPRRPRWDRMICTPQLCDTSPFAHHSYSGLGASEARDRWEVFRRG
jgi:hypothetical protein